MKRSVKNIIMVLLIIAIGVCSYATMESAGAGTNASPNISSASYMGTPPEMPSGDNQSSDSDSSSSNSQQPPEMPSGNNQSSDSDSSSSNSQQPPEMPGGEAPSDMKGKSSSKTIDTKYYILFALEALVLSAVLVYLILSGFNKRNFRETMKNAKIATVYVLSVAIIATGLTFAQGAAACTVTSGKTSQSRMQGGPQGAPGGQGSAQSAGDVDAAGAKAVTSDETLKDSYTSTTSDESAILVSDGGNATIDGAKVTKTGDSSNTENSEFYGVNSGILVQKSSTATIKNATISTDAKGSNAVFATGENAKIYISDSTITTTGASSSRGLDATYGGYIEADNVKITTQGGSCATLATDRGEGTVIAKNSTLETNGAGSPVIYSTGDIQIEKTTGTANGSQMVVIEGKNSATVTDSTLTASGIGNRNNVDQCGIMIYQSMSGDAGEGTGTFTAKNSTLSVSESSSVYKTAPMFFITNTNAVINLNNTKLSYGSGVLISAKSTSEWGNEGSNGGNVTLNAESQSLSGNVEADSISTVTMNLTSSSFEGTINADNSAKEVTLKLDKNSKIKLTGDSYVTSLDDADSTYSNIDFNGFTLYVNGKAIN